MTDFTLSDRLREVREALHFYSNIDAEAVKLLAGFKATPDMRDPNSVADRALVAMESIIAEVEALESTASDRTMQMVANEMGTVFQRAKQRTASDHSGCNHPYHHTIWHNTETGMDSCKACGMTWLHETPHSGCPNCAVNNHLARSK